MKRKVRDLSMEIFNLLDFDKIVTDSKGIYDGQEIVNDFLDYNEIGLALEHLQYVIDELELNIPSELEKKLNRLKLKYGVL